MNPRELFLNVERLEFNKPGEKEFSYYLQGRPVRVPDVTASANDHRFNPKDYKWLKIWG